MRSTPTGRARSRSSPSPRAPPSAAATPSQSSNSPQLPRVTNRCGREGGRPPPDTQRRAIASSVWRGSPSFPLPLRPFVMPLFFAFLFDPAFFFALLLVDLALLVARQRELRRDFLAGPAVAGLEPDQLGMEEGADRREVAHPDDVVQL